MTFDLRQNQLTLLDWFNIKQDVRDIQIAVLTDQFGNQESTDPLNAVWFDQPTRRVWHMTAGAAIPGYIRCVKVPRPQVGLVVMVGKIDGSAEAEVLFDASYLRFTFVGNQDWSVTDPESLNPGGRLMEWIYSKQITPLNTFPGIAGLTISVQEGYYPYQGERRFFEGVTNFPLINDSNSGEHYYAGLYIDADNSLQAVYGSSVPTDEDAPEPTWPSGAFELSVVLVDDVQTSVDFDTDIFDRRMAWSDENSDALTVQDNGSDVGTEPILNFIEGENVALAITDDSGNSRVNVEIAALVSVQDNGTPVGTEPAINFIEGSNITLTITDNSPDSVDVEIASTGGSSLTPSATVEDETTYGITPDAGASADYSRGDHTHGSPPNIGLTIDAASSKATPVDADELGLADSAASFVLKKLTWANLKATLKTYFDTLYQPIGNYITALTGDVTATGPGSAAATIANNAVTDAKLRDSGALSVIGRSANSSGDPADISASAASGAVLRESGSTLGFGTIATAGVADNAVTNAKLADMADSTIKGRASGAGTGDPTDLTAAQVAAILVGLPNVWPRPNTLKIGTTEYATLALAVAAASSGDTIYAGVGTHTADNVTIPAGVNLFGADPYLTKFTTSTSTTCLTFSAGCQVGNFTVTITTNSASTTQAISIASNDVILLNVGYSGTNAGAGISYGCNISGGTGIELWGNRGNTSKTRSLFITGATTSVRIFGGIFVSFNNHSSGPAVEFNGLPRIASASFGTTGINGFYETGGAMLTPNLSGGGSITLTTGATISLFDTDGTLAANSDTRVATQKATKTYADTKIAQSFLDAKGDLISASANDTPVILTVGANDTVLVADSAQTSGLKWAAAILNSFMAAKGDLITATANDTPVILGVGSNGQVLLPDSSQSSGLVWSNTGDVKNLLYHSLTHDIWNEGTTFNDIADDTYVADLWTVLQNGQAPDVSGVAGGASENFKRCFRCTFDSASSQCGIVQFLETEDTVPLRGKTLSISADLWGTNVGTLRMAILEWAGTADSLTSDVVGTWGTGNPTLAANWSYIGTPAAITISGSQTRYAVSNLAVGASTNNLAIFIWTDALEGSGDLFNVANVCMEESKVATPFVAQKMSDEKLGIMRFFEAVVPTASFGFIAEGFAISTTATRIVMPYLVEKRIVPSFTFSAGDTFNIQNSAGSNITAATIAQSSSTEKIALLTPTTAGSLTAGDGVLLGRDSTDTTFIYISARL